MGSSPKWKRIGGTRKVLVDTVAKRDTSSLTVPLVPRLIPPATRLLHVLAQLSRFPLTGTSRNLLEMSQLVTQPLEPHSYTRAPLSSSNRGSQPLCCTLLVNWLFPSLFLAFPLLSLRWSTPVQRIPLSIPTSCGVIAFRLRNCRFHADSVYLMVD